MTTTEMLNPTSRPSQPGLPPLEGRGAKRRARQVEKIRTAQQAALAAPSRRANRGQDRLKVRLPQVAPLFEDTPKPLPAAAPTTRRSQREATAKTSVKLPKLPKIPARSTSRRAQDRPAKSLMDWALIVTVTLVGLLMVGVGIVGIVQASTSYPVNAIGFFNGSVGLVAGIAWTAIAPFKVVQHAE